MHRLNDPQASTTSTQQSARDRRRPALIIGLFALLAILAALIVALVAGWIGDRPAVSGGASTPSASVQPGASTAASTGPSERSDAPAASPKASAAPTDAAEIGLAEGWVEAASFGSDTSIDSVLDVTEAPFGYIAVGVSIGMRELPVFGPVPQEGRVWRSDDGRSWQDVTPQGTFGDMMLTSVVARPDGTVVAFGTASLMLGGAPSEAYAAWETADGESWTGAEITLGTSPALDMAVGGPGFVAVHDPQDGTASSLWFSADGRTFQAAHTLPAPWHVRTLQGGPEGFVAIALNVETGSDPLALASGDGRDWFQAEVADQVWSAGALGRDWVAIAAGLDGEPTEPGEAVSWWSPNGLEWSAAGSLPLAPVALDERTSCREVAWSVVSAGSLVVAPTTFSGPCGEGRIVRYGAAHVSADGSAWERLPFTSSTIALDGSTRGTTASAGLTTDAGIVLVGESDYRAAFWYRPSGE